MSSAACGADLLALHAAGELGIRRYIVLPFDRRRFRETSVTDRPGGDDRWGPLFDHILDDVPEDDITTLGETGNGDGAYRATNACALQQAQTLADERGTRAAAIVVWEGAANGAGDLTASFVEAARDLGIDVYEILTR
ncbi:MAG TPA: hypothetical protein VMM18_17285 [Gemmatimonadaceae bacterium]|nr:hypothetical protein [Gemmatimonadaceae bacterium]